MNVDSIEEVRRRICLVVDVLSELLQVNIGSCISHIGIIWVIKEISNILNSHEEKISTYGESMNLYWNWLTCS